MVKLFNYKVYGSGNDFLIGKNVIIYGLSVSALQELVMMNAKGIKVVAFADSYSKTKGEFFAGVRIISVNDIGKIDNPTIFVPTRNPEVLQEILYNLEEKLCIKDIEIYGRVFVYGAGEYNTELLSAKIEKDRKEIDYVRQHLDDEASVKTFDNLLKYRTTNDRRLIEEIYEKKHNQYFPERDIFNAEDIKTFIDCGAYDGDTCIKYAEWNKTYEKIYILEPDKNLFNVMKEYVKICGLKNYETINKGAYSSIKRVSFTEKSDSGSSCICNEGVTSIETITIDELVDKNDKDIYIKMDIEGAELEALIGAHKTIETKKPKLAICIYHKDDDLWKIPYYLMTKYPWYHFYIRHYTNITTETIIYAV